MTSVALSAAELCVLSCAVEAMMPLAVYGSPNFDEILNCNATQFQRCPSLHCDALRDALGLDRLDASDEPAGSWAATYWKTLVGGERVRFHTDGREPDIHTSGHRAMRHLEGLWRSID
jgi:hypothetical protein